MTDEQSNASPSQPGLHRGAMAVVLVLAIAGCGISIELTRIHYLTHTDPAYRSVCAVNDEINCETVARSPYSVFCDLPVSVWGIIGYVAIGLLAFWALNRRRLHPTWGLGLLTVIATVTVTVSVTLGYISVTRIDSICIFCTSLYALNGVFFLVAVFDLVVSSRKSPFTALREDIIASLHHPLPVALLAACCAATVALALALVPSYWQQAGWQDLPDLPSGSTPDGYHWIGARDPEVTIVEFSDYQCPFCRRAHHSLRAEAGKYPEQVRVIHRHLPLDSNCNADIKRVFHERACEFAKAAECAARQKRFWPMNDALFSVQETTHTSDVDLEALAVGLGLDRSGFKACMATGGYPESMSRDMNDSRRLGVAGTPTFFIGDRAYEGGIPRSALRRALGQSDSDDLNEK